jgi:hypothetical protein
VSSELKKTHLRNLFGGASTVGASILTKISKVILIFFTPEFALEMAKFQNSEYEVHQSSPTNEG